MLHLHMNTGARFVREGMCTVKRKQNTFEHANIVCPLPVSMLHLHIRQGGYVCGEERKQNAFEHANIVCPLLGSYCQILKFKVVLVTTMNTKSNAQDWRMMQLARKMVLSLNST